MFFLDIISPVSAIAVSRNTQNNDKNKLLTKKILTCIACGNSSVIIMYAKFTIASRLGNTNVGYFICMITGAQTSDFRSFKDKFKMEMVSLRGACSLPEYIKKQ